jgi:hypothetical protein
MYPLNKPFSLLLQTVLQPEVLTLYRITLFFLLPPSVHILILLFSLDIVHLRFQFGLWSKRDHIRLNQAMCAENGHMSFSSAFHK